MLGTAARRGVRPLAMQACLRRSGPLVQAVRPEVGPRVELDDALPIQQVPQVLLQQEQQRRGLAGHSKWHNIQHRKGAQDKARAAVNTQYSRLIAVAVQQGGGADPTLNFQLEAALKRAHRASIPKKVIENAIKIGSGEHASEGKVERVIYEGAGVGGALFMVECLTNKRSRTAPLMRHLFNKHGGHMEANTASFAFEHVGYAEVFGDTETLEKALDVAIESGATDVVLPQEQPDESMSSDSGHAEEPDAAHPLKVYCEIGDLEALTKALKAASFDVHNEHLIYHPKDALVIDDEAHLDTLHKLVDSLEDCEDVSKVFHNIA